jgi:hypothetical protein
MVMGVAGAASAATSTFFDFNGDMAADTLLIIPIGTTFTADIYGTSDEASGIGTASVRVSFDITQFNVLSMIVGIPPGQLTIANIFDNAAGTADIGWGVVFPPVTATPFLIGSIDFSFLGPGNLVMGETFPALPNFDGFVAFDGTVLDSSVTYGSAQVVPIPGSVLLLGSGLLGLVGIRRKKKLG